MRIATLVSTLKKYTQQIDLITIIENLTDDDVVGVDINSI